jgi:hypothetical protein
MISFSFFIRIVYIIKGGSDRELVFQRNEAATPAPIVKKAGKGLSIAIASGLPKETGNSPFYVCLQETKQKEFSADIHY